MKEKEIMNGKRVLYTIYVDDLQSAAVNMLGREMTAGEIVMFEKFIAHSLFERWFLVQGIMVDLFREEE